VGVSLAFAQGICARAASGTRLTVSDIGHVSSLVGSPTCLLDQTVCMAEYAITRAGVHHLKSSHLAVSIRVADRAAWYVAASGRNR
jgi:hypothetical protein